LSSATPTGPEVEVSLNSVFASRKHSFSKDDKASQTSAMFPSNFQVSAKIDEESRKDNRLLASFLFTLNDSRGMVTYEFRGFCSITGSSADFESVMEAHKDARVPKILDIIYQRLYPIVFMLAGMTTSTYPQSVALITEMISSGPVQLSQANEPAEPENGKMSAPKAEKIIIEDKAVVLEQNETKINQAQPPSAPPTTNGTNHGSKSTSRLRSTIKAKPSPKPTTMEIGAAIESTNTVKSAEAPTAKPEELPE